MSTPNLSRVIDEVVIILREHFDTISESSITILSSHTSIISPNTKLPLVEVYDAGFSTEQVGLGIGFGSSREEREERFNGGGKQTTFRLSAQAVKSILDVTVRKQNVEDNKAHNLTMYEHDDFRADYKNNAVVFRHPPEKGDKNVIVRYITGKTTGEIRALRLKIKCFIDIWSDDLMQCNMITEEIMKVMMEKEELLSASGININSPEGYSLLNKGNINNESHNGAAAGDDLFSSSSSYSGLTSAEAKKTSHSTTNEITNNTTTISYPAFGKRLVYIAETYLKVEREVPTIRKIEIKEKAEDQDKKEKHS